MRYKINKKGQLLGSLGGTFQQIAFLGIFGAIMLIILATLRSDSSINDGSLGGNLSLTALDNSTASIGNVFQQLPLFGTILGLLLIVGIVFLLVRGNRGGVL